MSISNKILDRLSKRLQKETPYRSDFVLADFKVLDHDKKSAEILIQYDGGLFGVPSKELVAQTVMLLYKAPDERPRVTVDTSSIKYFPQHEAVSCVVNVPSIRRPFDDVKRYNLTPVVGGTMFLGENMEDTWKVSKGAEGSVFIERLEEDDIDTILRERSRGRAFRTHASTSLTLNRVAASAPETSYSVGDRVKCTFKGKLREGEVVGVSQAGAQIRFDTGEQGTVTTAGLFGVVQAAAKSHEMNLEAIKEYYRKAYGYSEEDLNKLVTFVE